MESNNIRIEAACQKERHDFHRASLFGLHFRWQLHPLKKLKRGRGSYGRRGAGHVVFAPLDADGAAGTARGEERIDLAHRPELRGRGLLADAHVVRLLRVGVDGADDRKTRGNAAAVERLRLDRAVVVDGRSLQVH